jgi:hypothetical protein
MKKTAKAQSAERRAQSAKRNPDSLGFHLSIPTKSGFQLTPHYSNIPLFHFSPDEAGFRLTPQHSNIPLSNCRILPFFHSSIFPLQIKTNDICCN